MGPQEIMRKEKARHPSDSPTAIPAANTSAAWLDEPSNSTEHETTSQPSWWSNEAESSEGEEEFVSAVSSAYEASDANTGSGRPTAEPPPFLPVQMVLTWLPPKPPTAFDGFHINIEREGKSLCPSHPSFLEFPCWLCPLQINYLVLCWDPCH